MWHLVWAGKAFADRFGSFEERCYAGLRGTR